LPGDIRDKTIHTVVTKPVRRLEIVVGRIIGLTVITTALLIVMGVVSYVYMRRSVNGSLGELRQRMAEAKQKDNVKYEQELKDSIEQIESRLIARVPVYGELVFTNPPKNVGKETIYRGFIEGNSADAAIWHFKNVPINRIQAMHAIPMEMNFSVFRTTKGELGKGVIAQVTYANLKTARQITDYPFPVREYYTEKHTLDNTPDKTYIENGQPLPAPPDDPINWLCQASDGELVVAVRCLSGSQYLGMAPPDLYILLDTASFGVNFAKGMLGVWLRVFLIICVAVMFSTFLSSYVAMLATAAVFFGGLCVPYLSELAHGTHKGGGPMEAAQRLVTHENLERELDPGLWTDIIKSIDGLLRFLVRVITHVLPDLGFYNTAPFVANGFDISATVLLANIVVAFAYAVPITIFAYFLLHSREIAR
jgi:ABC-type transport system involved in multi-copper enzyme maturation permease subunit